jgi:hypothetical protein
MAQAPGGTFKRIRVAILLGILCLVAYQTWHDHWSSTRWRVPLYVAIYPIAADDSPVTVAYVAGLEAARFLDIDRFFVREGTRYHLSLDTPLKTRLRAPLGELPPHHDPQAGPLANMLYSLELRYWAFRHSRRVSDPEDIRIFVLYHDPERTAVVPHSLGLAKGLIGVVYAFATPRMDGSNAMVIAHELLHTVGATDKYDPLTGGPRFPDGYGDPEQRPLHPQRYAELMGGRRVLDAHHFEQPASLEDVLIGPATAAEIHWPAEPDPPPAAGERPSAQLSARSTAACSAGVAAASTEVAPSPSGAPSRSVKQPPASITMAAQAPMSRMLMSVSITTSRWPDASR